MAPPIRELAAGACTEAVEFMRRRSGGCAFATSTWRGGGGAITVPAGPGVADIMWRTMTTFRCQPRSTLIVNRMHPRRLSFSFSMSTKDSESVGNDPKKASPLRVRRG